MTSAHDNPAHWRRPPRQPASGGRLYRRYQAASETWARVFLPEVAPSVAVRAVRDAIEVHRAGSALDVLEHLADPAEGYADRADVRALLARVDYEAGVAA
jgi:hypothetical protein